jgi:hypothetical protein
MSTMKNLIVACTLIIAGCGGGSSSGSAGGDVIDPGTRCPILTILLNGDCVSILEDPPPPDTTTIRPFLTAGTPVLSTVTIDWVPPSESWEGIAPPFLAGYVVYVSEPVGGFYQVVEQVRLDNPGLVTYVLDMPGPGRWGVSVTAISTSGNESAHSNLEEIIIE